MNKLNNFKFSAWKDGTERCCIEAQIPGSELRYISFYMSGNEFRALANGKIESLNDISHNLRSLGDMMTFYDLEFRSDDHGVMQVPYVNVQFPMFARRILLKWAEKQWKKEPSYQRPVIEVSQKRLDNWVRLYGHGKGSARVVVSDALYGFYEENMKAEGNFGERVQQLVDIAQGYTNCFWQEAEVRLYKDWDGFYFTTHLGKKNGLNGGLINHGRDGKADWSIHT